MRWVVSLLGAAALAGCALGSGVVPVGPGMYALTEMRAPVRGGGAEAQRAVMEGASGFCAQQRRQPVVLALQPGGDPRLLEWPTAFSLTFRCA